MAKLNSKLADIQKVQKLPVEQLIVAIRIAEDISRRSRGARSLSPGGRADSACIGIWILKENYIGSFLVISLLLLLSCHEIRMMWDGEGRRFTSQTAVPVDAAFGE